MHTQSHIVASVSLTEITQGLVRSPRHFTFLLANHKCQSTYENSLMLTRKNHAPELIIS